MYSFFFFQAEDGIRDLTVTGVQTCALPISAKAAPSKLHSKVREEGGVTLSDPAKSKLGDVFVVLEPSAGPPVMVVSGGVTSTVHANEAPRWSVLPAASVAVTVKTCAPAARPE